MTINDNVIAGAFPIVIVGHVDHGKSTLIGRLLNDTGSLPEGKAEELRRVSKHRGMAVEWSFALDALQLERDQAITVDSTQVWFQSPLRRYVIIDAPGHLEFLRNMITGAAQAEAAVIVVDATQGLTEQTKRHAYLLHLLGVSQAIVAINKMDKVDFDRSIFNRLASEMKTHLASLSLEAVNAIPVSAREGDNLAKPSARMAWWNGPTLIEALDVLPRRRATIDKPLRLAVQDVYHEGDERIIVGRIESGRLKVGDPISFWPTQRTARVKSFQSWSTAAPILSAAATQSVAFTITEDLFVERGHVVATADRGPRQSTSVRARLFWLAPGHLHVGKTLRMRVGTSTVSVTVSAIHGALDVDDLAFHQDRAVATNDIAEVRLTSSVPFTFDLFHENETLGRAVLIDGYNVVAGCVIDRDADVAAITASSATGASTITIHERARRNKHQGAVYWLTGLSGAGKSTLAIGLQQKLFDLGAQVAILDGDALRRGLNSDLGYAPQDRTENLRRAAEVAKILLETGSIVIAAFISPAASDRDMVRNIVGGPFHEVFVNADLAICEARDVKGLYAKARAGSIAEFTGISSAWETPEHPELVVNTGAESYEKCLEKLLTYVRVTAIEGGAIAKGSHASSAAVPAGSLRA
ncbi:MAG: adenylyl-sulfate kinase [Rhodospirillaceae bacterium]|nr:adenylyl-sulfate kinase [Rhodospirillaceae bacterium]